jgi:hypothetical protein
MFKRMFQPIFATLLFLVLRKAKREFLEEAGRLDLLVGSDDSQFDDLHRQALSFFSEESTPTPPATPALPAPDAASANGTPPKRPRGRPRKEQPPEKNATNTFLDITH